MLALDILFHCLELVATFAVGAWTGSSHCRVAFAVSTDEERRFTWLDKVCGCTPQIPCKPQIPWKRGKSAP